MAKRRWGVGPQCCGGRDARPAHAPALTLGLLVAAPAEGTSTCRGTGPRQEAARLVLGWFRGCCRGPAPLWSCGLQRRHEMRRCWLVARRQLGL